MSTGKKIEMTFGMEVVDLHYIFKIPIQNIFYSLIYPPK